MTKIIRNTRELTASIKQKALELGYASCGITDASPFTEFLDGVEKRIQCYPESAHLYQGVRENGHPGLAACGKKAGFVEYSRPLTDKGLLRTAYD